MNQSVFFLCFLFSLLFPSKSLGNIFTNIAGPLIPSHNLLIVTVKAIYVHNLLTESLTLCITGCSFYQEKLLFILVGRKMCRSDARKTTGRQSLILGSLVGIESNIK